MQFTAALDEETSASRNELIDTFQKHHVQSGMEFAGCLASLLLRTATEDRVLAARLLVRVGGIGEGATRLVAQLLTALLHDEPEVAIQAARSLENVGSEAHIPLLMQSFRHYSGNYEVLLPVLACIGELGSPQTVDHVLELYSITANTSVQQAIDAAIVRLYDRHYLPLFNPIHRERFLSQIDGFQYALALDTLTDHGTDLCLAVAHKRYLRGLTQYADYRVKANQVEALEELNRLSSYREDKQDSALAQIVAKWKEEAPTPDKNGSTQSVLAPIWRLAELFYLADIEYLTRNHEGFVTRLYNLIEQLSLRLLESLNVTLTRRNDYYYLDSEWIAHHQEVAKVVKNQDSKRNLTDKVERVLTRLILEAYPQNDRAREGADHLLRFERLIKIRHKLPTAHGFDASNEETFVKAYGADFPTIIGDLRVFFQIATSCELGSNPYVDLNTDIRYVLISADSVEPSARDLLA